MLLYQEQQEQEEVVFAMKRGSKGSIFGNLKTIDSQIVSSPAN